MSNPVIDCLLAHRSVRTYRPDPVPQEVQRIILEAGTRAATAGNLQLYSFLVLDDRETIGLFRSAFGRVISTPPLIIIALVDVDRIRRWLRSAGAVEPILDRPVYFMLGLWDALIALQNVVVAAESLGLGTCYYGAIQEFDIQSHFGAPTLVFPAGMICLGYPDEAPDASTRLPLEAVVHRNRYTVANDETVRRYYREREMVWDSLSEERKEKLRSQGIRNLPQAISAQRFTDEPTRTRSRGILDSLRRAGFRMEI